MRPAGWRLLAEPLGDAVAWSLICVDDEQPQGQVWAGFTDDASRVRERVLHAVSDSQLTDSIAEASFARDVGAQLLPAPLRDALAHDGPRATLTLLVRGWLALVPWDALAVNWDGVRVCERCLVSGGLAPGLTADLALRPTSPAAGATLWLVDPGPPAGPWPSLFPDGYPPGVRQGPGPGDDLAPDGLPFSASDLATSLGARRWGQLAYFGHVTSDPRSPAASALVLSDDRVDLFSAHRWLADPGRWPAPNRVALIGCGSDDSVAVEQAGLPTAALQAGAGLVTTTRWPLPNTGASWALFKATVLTQQHGASAVRRWQLTQLDRWRRTQAAEASPLYWASLVTYDRRLLTEGTPAHD